MCMASSKPQTKGKAMNAASSKFLGLVKARMNEPIYRKCREIFNASGADDALAYLGGFFREDRRESALQEFRDALPKTLARGSRVRVLVKHLVRRFSPGRALGTVWCELGDGRVEVSVGSCTCTIPRDKLVAVKVTYENGQEIVEDQE